jgi:hypothetical protein
VQHTQGPATWGVVDLKEFTLPVAGEGAGEGGIVEEEQRQRPPLVIPTLDLPVEVAAVALALQVVVVALVVLRRADEEPPRRADEEPPRRRKSPRCNRYGSVLVTLVSAVLEPLILCLTVQRLVSRQRPLVIPTLPLPVVAQVAQVAQVALVVQVVVRQAVRQLAVLVPVVVMVVVVPPAPVVVQVALLRQAVRQLAALVPVLLIPTLPLPVLPQVGRQAALPPMTDADVHLTSTSLPPMTDGDVHHHPPHLTHHHLTYMQTAPRVGLAHLVHSVPTTAERVQSA